MADICQLEDVKTELGLTDTSLDDLLLRYIRGVTRFVERYTRRTFQTTTETRVFDGNDKGYLQVPDFQSLVAVSLLNPDGTAWRSFTVATELKGEPYNETPKNKIVIVNHTTENPYRVIGRSPYIFPRGIANVSVNAVWGSYGSVPEDLEEVAIALVKAKYNRKAMQGIQSASIGGESVTFAQSDLNQEQQATLEDYKRYFSEVWR